MNIKVAVRLRPFNKREQKLKSQLCVQMKDKTVSMLKENKKVAKSFVYDYCLWSHDEFEMEKNGYLKPDSKKSKYIDQKKIYQILGKDMLDNFIKGFNCCLLAYGQTGSGKSYSIFGYDSNRGIVPQICEDLFNGQVQQMFESKDIQTLFKISMIEIYNEKVYDLLVPVLERDSGGLKIRENEKLGVYVEGQKQFEVKSYDEIKQIIDKGNENKSIGSTQMNNSSSRSHTIILMSLKQIKNESGKKTQKLSQFFLVDLAGSEKIKKTAAQNDRLKEACSINKSLTVLGLVINQLYKKTQKKKKKIVVSYRNSALTRLLKNAIGGNSKTTMICALSPARDNYDETLSTLRYADQAKQIKQKAVINQSPVDKLIKELTQENQRLLKIISSINLDDLQKQDILNQQLIVDKEIATEQKSLKGLKNKTKIKQNEIKRQTQFKQLIGLKQVKISKTKFPLIVNLNEDPLLSEKILYSFENQSIIEIGRQKDSDSGIRIILNSVGILQDHAKIILKQDKLYLIADEPDAAYNCFINGQCLEDFEIEENDDIYFEKQLRDMDRLIFGTCTTFLVRIPQNGKIKKNVKVDGQNVDWEFCQLEKFELQENQERLKYLKILEQKKQEIKEREQKLIEQFEAEKLKYEQQIKKQQEEYEQNLQQLRQKLGEKLQENLNKENSEQNQQLEQKQKEIQDIKNHLKIHQLQFKNQIMQCTNQNNFISSINSIEKKLKEKLIYLYPKLKEANIISEELNRRIQFVPYVTKMDIKKKSSQNNLYFQIKILNHEDGIIYFWNLDKFEQRLEIMREIYNNFLNNQKINFDDLDPFNDDKQDFLFAKSVCLQSNILHKKSNNLNVEIIGLSCSLGTLNISILALDSNHLKVDEQKVEQFIEDPKDLIKFDISCNFQVVINSIQFNDISDIENKKLYIKFKLKSQDQTESFQTQNITISNTELEINQEFSIDLVQVNKQIIDYYLKEKLVFNFYIIDLEEIQKLGKLPLPILNMDKMQNEQLLKQNQQIHQELINQMNQNENRKSMQRQTIFEQTNFSKRVSKNLCNIF